LPCRWCRATFKTEWSTFIYFQKTGQGIFCALIDEALTLEGTVHDRDARKLGHRIGVGQYISERSEHFIATNKDEKSTDKSRRGRPTDFSTRMINFL
jgi:hypothetical protein